MLFNSYTFIFLFLPLVWVGFYASIRVAGHAAGRIWLLLGSLFFYAWWNPVHLPLFLASIAANYTLGELIASPARSRATRKRIMLFGVALNVGLLAWFKYADFVLRSTLGTLGYVVEPTGILIPLAISFFTFQQIAYLVDAYKAPEPRRSLLDYSLFVSFFPQLVAGPIIHHQELIPQVRSDEPYRARAANVSVGLAMFAFGLFKKVVIADQLAQHADAVFSGASAGIAPGPALAWLATLAFTLQVYFDFSGYSDMALGLARMFGIRLPMNFDSPLKATTISEFWRRWHITLSRFLRAYVYIPLGGSRAGLLRRHANLVITMLVSGIWHGAAWTFVAWGLAHGLFLIIQHHWSRRFRLPASAPQWRRTFRAAWGRVMTFLAFALSLVLFRASGFDAAWLVFKGLAGVGETVGGNVGGETSAPAPLTEAWIWVGAAWLIVWTMPNVQEILRKHEPALDWTPSRTKWRLGRVQIPYPAWRPTLPWVVVAVALLAWSVLNLDRVTIFVYWQF